MKKIEILIIAIIIILPIIGYIFTDWEYLEYASEHALDGISLPHMPMDWFLFAIVDSICILIGYVIAKKIGTFKEK